MGIPKLFKVITNKNATRSAITLNATDKLNINYFYMDFNSIVHIIEQTFITTLYESLYKTIASQKPYKTGVKYIDNIFDAHGDINKDNIYHIYLEYFTADRIEDIVIQLVIEQIYKMIKKFIGNKLRLLYISIDGVPSKSKMLEQKQRRYMGAIIHEYKNVLLKKYKVSLKETHKYQYEKTKMKLRFNKSKISPGTAFMNKLSSKLEEERPNFLTICDEYILDTSKTIGEAEKKIVDHIKKMGDISKCMIFSTDADMILLVCLLDIKECYILKHNQQTSSPILDKDSFVYDIINIDNLKDNIFYYLKDDTVDKNNYIKDIICLWSLFGNDFIPNIESIDVDSNFGQLLNIYLDTLNFFDKKVYLTEYRHKYYLNSNFLFKFLENYWDVELFNMKEIYMMRNFRLYKRFKTIYSNNGNDINHANFDYMNKMFEQYCKKLIELSKMKILTQRVEYVYDKLADYINENPIDAAIGKYNVTDFLNQVKELVKMESDNDMDFLKDFIFNPKQIFKYSDSKYDNKSSTFMHKQAITSMANRGEISPFYKEYYIFSNLLDNYAEMLKNKPINLINLDSSPSKTIAAYYKKFFHIDDYVLIDDKKESHSINQNLDDIINCYLEGLLWTFNYYYNDGNNISTWYYKYEKAPILRDIYMYISDNPNGLREIYNRMKKYDVDPSDFFNETEQLLYVTPRTADNELIIPPKYLNFFRTNQYYDDNDIHIITNNLEDNIDCTGARFLNKCAILSLKKYDTEYDMQFIKTIRQIK